VVLLGLRYSIVILDGINEQSYAQQTRYGTGASLAGAIRERRNLQTVIVLSAPGFP
jgi:hypothetical protein